MQTSAEHELRSQATADSLRRYLIGFNTGGITALLAGATSLSSLCVDPSWVVPASFCFALGLIVVLVSLFVQKHKALERRDASLAGRDPPDFTKGFMRNFTLDLVALAAFICGVAFALSSFASLSPGC